MLAKSLSEDGKSHLSTAMKDDAIDPSLVQDELRRILTSRHFRTSRRGKEFLEYVVHQKIDGHTDLLKERLIGVHLFGRTPDYATGEDPVVRVQAGDVRRRLESYYADPDVQFNLLIQIPVGSYAPVFVSRETAQPDETWSGSLGPSLPGKVEALAAKQGHPTEINETFATGLVEPPSDLSSTLAALHPTDHAGEAALGDASKEAGWRNAKVRRLTISALTCLAFLGVLLASYIYIHKTPEWTLKAFWSPASLATKPVLICLPRPIVYRPSEKLYDKYQEAHPDAFVTREARRDQVLPLALTDTIQWGDMTPVRNSGPGIGAVVAAVNISKLLAEQGIRFELRFGEEATYADMRDSPVVIIGAINSDWATQLTSDSHFIFDETRGAPNIRETAGAQRFWKMESSNGNITRDYGLITRQLSGKAGQFLVQVAGISHFGTQAASEFLANKKDFTSVLHDNAINLKQKNFQIVVSTDVTAGRAGPPQIVAISSW